MVLVLFCYFFVTFFYSVPVRGLPSMLVDRIWSSSTFLSQYTVKLAKLLILVNENNAFSISITWVVLFPLASAVKTMSMHP